MNWARVLTNWGLYTLIFGAAVGLYHLAPLILDDVSHNARKWRKSWGIRRARRARG